MISLGKWRSGKGRLNALLADYPAWTPPHLGHVLTLPGDRAPVLTSAQALENLKAYRDVVPARIAVLRPVLSSLGCDVDEAYGDAAKFVRSLHPALLAELPALYCPDLARRDAWELSPRRGDAIVLTFMADLAMLAGDVLIRARPGAFWGVDLDPRDRNKFARNRPCLLGLADRLFPKLPPAVFHLEAEWFGYYANMDDPGRLAPPRPPSGSWFNVIGGTLPERLDRYVPHPDLERLRAEGWMAKAG